MAGRLIDLKKTIPFLEMEQMSKYGLNTWGLQDILEETKNDRELEKYKGDVIEPCLDTPCCFTPGPSRSYYVRYVPYASEQDDGRYYDYFVVSAYKPFLENIYTNAVYAEGKYGNTLFNCPCNICILMIADGTFAGAVYKEGNAVASKEIVSFKSSRMSKSEKEDFRQRVKDHLQKWDNLINSSTYVFVRCTYDDKIHFFEGKGETGDSRFRHIPFVTGKPTLREVDRVYDRLTRAVLYETVENTLKELRNERKSFVSSTSDDVHEGNTESSRRLEKKMWPWMNSNLAKRIVDYVEDDDGNGLYDEVQAHPKKTELLEYFNSCHSKFNNGTFLHFAVQKEAISAVEILLEIGCDPTVSDVKTKVPFEYCRTKDIQDVFIEYRTQHPDLFNWNKAKVPEKSNTPLHNERKKESENPKKIDVERRKRSEKLKNKKVKNYED